MAEAPLDRFNKHERRRLTRRMRDVSLARMIEDLKLHLNGWKAYFLSMATDGFKEAKGGLMFSIRKGALAASLVASLSVCNSMASSAASVPPPMKRTIYMAAIEPKGSTSVDKEPFPKVPLPAGEGYELKAPDKEGKWEVETYAWLPGSITVYQGDEVTLHVVGINGALHPVSIEGYGLKYVVKRGEITTVSFKADKAGIFEIICHKHRPAMTGQLIVLPRSQK